jgi:hypothetical protein
MAENRESADFAEMRKTLLAKTQKSDGGYADGDMTDSFSALDLSQQSKLAVTDDRKRESLLADTNKRTDSRCKVCASNFFPVYQEWLSIHKFTGQKCEKFALKYFQETISKKSFTNHKKNHMQNPMLVRRLIIANDPHINPLKVVDSIIAVLQQQILETDMPDSKMLGQLRDYLALHGDFTGETKKVPEKAVQINTYNFQRGGSIPNSQDNRLLDEAPMSDQELTVLRELGVFLGDKGTQNIREQIPKEIPTVQRKNANVVDAEVED